MCNEENIINSKLWSKYFLSYIFGYYENKLLIISKVNLIARINKPYILCTRGLYILNLLIYHFYYIEDFFLVYIFYKIYWFYNFKYFPLILLNLEYDLLKQCSLTTYFCCHKICLQFFKPKKWIAWLIQFSLVLFMVWCYISCIIFLIFIWNFNLCLQF